MTAESLHIIQLAGANKYDSLPLHSFYSTTKEEILALSSPELISICIVQLTHTCLLALPPIAYVLVSVSISEGPWTVGEVRFPLALKVETQQRERERERESSGS